MIRDDLPPRAGVAPGHCSPVLQRRAVSQSDANPDGLTDRELDVLRLIGQGLSNQEIGDRLVISLPTVRTHINHIFSKLQLESRAQAILYVLRHDIASLDDSDPLSLT